MSNLVLFPVIPFIPHSGAILTGPVTIEPMNRHSFSQGGYEPEGIYLNSPFHMAASLVQKWGDRPDFYAQYKYNGITLKGYIGLGFDVDIGTKIHVMDRGKVSEINFELEGLERYIKVEHWWGESLYARLNGIQVESGQRIESGDALAFAGKRTGPFATRFHLGIRIHPYNRFDGWGGFSDPLPFLSPEIFGDPLTAISRSAATTGNAYPPLPLTAEKDQMRRP